MAEDLKDINTRGALVAIAVATIVIAIVFTLSTLGPAVGQSPKGDQYQAVFLTNGQVYFGKLKGTSGSYLTLKDVYYIQSNPQQAGGAASASPNPQLSLVQLGNEIHGPESQMQISSNQVIFWENLKGDSKVVEAINEKSKK